MAKVVAGLGRKRPQLNVPVKLLRLDPLNPRLAKEESESSELELLTKLYNDFDVEDLAYSMAANGYFDEEPIVVIPDKLPKDFELHSDVEKQQKQLQDLVDGEKIRFIVVEGNRRTATLKLLTDKDLRSKVKVNDAFPKASGKALDDLMIIPAIVYPDRTNISAYLGVRHIAGLLKWEAYAKAVFLASRIDEGVNEGKSVEESIQEVRRQTADRSDVIKKQYLCYKILKEAEEDLSFDTEEMRNRFSLITVALNSPSIREFVGVKPYKEVDFSKRVVPLKKLEKLDLLLGWIYGNGQDRQPILTDSRKITSRLAPILADEDSTEYLIKYGTLEEAYERSGGEKIFLMKKLNDGEKNLRHALTIAYKFKTKDVIDRVDEIISVGDELKKMVSK